MKKRKDDDIAWNEIVRHSASDPLNSVREREWGRVSEGMCCLFLSVPFISVPFLFFLVHSFPCLSLSFLSVASSPLLSPSPLPLLSSSPHLCRGANDAARWMARWKMDGPSDRFIFGLVKQRRAWKMTCQPWIIKQLQSSTDPPVCRSIRNIGRERAMCSKVTHSHTHHRECWVTRLSLCFRGLLWFHVVWPAEVMNTSLSTQYHF